MISLGLRLYVRSELKVNISVKVTYRQHLFKLTDRSVFN